MIIKTNKQAILILLILIFGLGLRLIGLNWDQNQHLHPDERFLTMVVTEVKWPSSLAQYLNPSTSSLNPYNTQYKFFVYGTLPLKVVKFLAQFLIFNNFPYHNITLVGRFTSAVFELGTLILVYLIAKKLFSDQVGLLAAFFYAIAALPIQLAHFFAVDTFLVFFLILSWHWLISIIQTKSAWRYWLGLGLSFGLALACKITALYLLPFIFFTWLWCLWKKHRFWCTIFSGLVMAIITYLTFRLADPRVFSSANWFNFNLNPQFRQNISELKALSSPEGSFPPSVQWLSAMPIWFPLKNLVWWGLGFPLAIVCIGGLFDAIGRFVFCFKSKHKLFNLGQLLLIMWIMGLFLYQGLQFAMAMRYFYPIYPALVMFGANLMVDLYQKCRKKYHGQFRLILWLIPLLILIYPLSFLSIYLHSHSRIQASSWIYAHIPPGSTISCEHWDDCLPVALNHKNSRQYQTETLALYASDQDSAKWQQIDQQLAKIDYLILSSNRLWGSITKVPNKYPLTSQFYQDLFAGKLNFSLTAKITSYPCFPPLGKPLFCLADQFADESFTVYDHPQVYIFQKN